jgi:protein tyrosine phosphatase (PTP) superfamily phosphohydrolase (DUF442 family)
MALIAASFAVLIGTTTASIVRAPTTRPFDAVSYGDDLHNAHIVTDKVISGAQPQGDAGFEALRALGVKTIISVDGAKPDVERAKRFGMRYVHLPIGYDGVSETDGKAIAKALVELPGPIYVHCHHGKHRSAAAVAVACVYNGMLPPQRAEDVLRTFGTGVNYKGLWSDTRNARPFESAELKGLEVEFVETAKIPELAEAMVKVDFHWEHLKSIRKSGWQAPADHPDLDPAHEALQVQEHLTEIARTPETQARPASYRRVLADAEQGASQLRDLLADPADRAAAEAAFSRVAATCTSCHADHRD